MTVRTSGCSADGARARAAGGRYHDAQAGAAALIGEALCSQAGDDVDIRRRERTA